MSARGGVGPLMVVEGDPASDAGLGLGPCFPSVQVNAFILKERLIKRFGCADLSA